MSFLDPSNEFHNRAKAKLEREQVAWLVSVGKDGTPQPSPIWFLWEGGDRVVIYSQEAPKVRNIEARPRIALHFNSDEHGNDVVIFTGSARVDRDAAKAVDNPAYLAKYAGGIASINYTDQTFSDDYHVPIHVTLENVRGY